MLTLQEISDRLEIQALMTAYAHAIDVRDFARLDAIVRTADGWRISKRVQQSCYRHNVPEHMQGATGPTAREAS